MVQVADHNAQSLHSSPTLGLHRQDKAWHEVHQTRPAGLKLPV